jgi:RHS repeat-associated protein
VVEFDQANAVTNRYILGDGRLIAQVNNDVRYFLADQQGSTRLLSDETGAITSSYDYSAFGETLSTNAETAYLYTGQQYDAATAMYSLRARYYAPGAGRFVSRDVWPVDYGDPWELNRYGYTANNPVRWADPSGWQVAAPPINSGSQSGGGTEYSILVGSILSALNRGLVVAIGAVATCQTMKSVSYLLALAKDGIVLTAMETLMPTPSPCHIPILLYPVLKTPAIAFHIWFAQYFLGKPMLLNYLGRSSSFIDPAPMFADGDTVRVQNLVGKNRDIACKGWNRNNLPILNFGPSCDEYPFASTYQGGLGASVMGVPDWEQSMQGNILMNFYRRAFPVWKPTIDTTFAVVSSLIPSLDIFTP